MKILIGETRIPAPGRKSEERIKREKEIEAFVLSGAAVAIADELPSKDPAYEKMRIFAGGGGGIKQIRMHCKSV